MLFFVILNSWLFQNQWVTSHVVSKNLSIIRLQDVLRHERCCSLLTVRWMAREWDEFSVTQKAFESFKAAHCDFECCFLLSSIVWSCTESVEPLGVHRGFGTFRHAYFMRADKRVQFRVKPELVPTCTCLQWWLSCWKRESSHAINRNITVGSNSTSVMMAVCQHEARRFCFTILWSLRGLLSLGVQ